RKMVETDASFVERIRALQIRKLMQADQGAADQPDDVTERAGVLVEDWFGVEQRFVPRHAAIEVAHCQGNVRDCRKVGHDSLLDASRGLPITPVGVLPYPRAQIR